MRYLILCFFLLFTTAAWSAELLVKAKPHWQDTYTDTRINKMTSAEKIHYDARSQIGDVIVVRPDGWAWGREECLPNFIVIKVPDELVSSWKYLEDVLYDTSMKIIKTRKYNIPKSMIETAVTDKEETQIRNATLKTVIVDKKKALKKVVR